VQNKIHPAVFRSRRQQFSSPEHSQGAILEYKLRAYSIIGSGSGFTANLGSDSLGKSNDFRLVKCEPDSLWVRIHCESYPDPIIEYALITA